MSSEELCLLCNDYFNQRNNQNKSLEPIQKYFSRLINDNKMIEMTPNVKSYIPALAKEQNGVLCPMLTATINGLSPTDYVPQLDLKFSLAAPREPSDASKSARNPRSNMLHSPGQTNSHISPRFSLNRSQLENLDTLRIHELPAPKTSRPYPNAKALITSRSIKKTGMISFRTPLPPLNQTECDILPQLYVSPTDEFYIGKKLNKESLEWSIIPPTFPDHLIGNNFNVMTTRGVVTLSDGEAGNVQSLHDFIKDKENQFIVENQMISKRVSFKSFYLWRQRLRERLFSKVISIYDTHNAISVPNFNSALEHMRSDVIAASEGAIVFTAEFDSKNEEAEFNEMKETANESIIEVDKKMVALKDQVGQQISEVFRVINASNVLIQLGFEELNSLNELPPSLKQYASDLKWRVPSLWRERMRETQLKYERKLAKDRQGYLSTFFTKVRINYNGILILKCKEMMMGFVDRFVPEPVNHRRPHKIHATFNENTGLDIIPNRNEFTTWVTRTLNSIKSAFFQELDKIWSDIVLEADPNYDYTIENPFNVVARFQDLSEKTQEALDSINDAYNYFEMETKTLSEAIKTLVKKINESAAFTNIRDIDSLQALLNELIKAKENIDKRPKNIFHHPRNTTESMHDFVISLLPAMDDAKKYYDRGMEALKLKVINELNLLFSEINERWSAVKDKKVTKMDSRALEARTLQYSLLCDVYCCTWKDAIADVKASFDTVMKMYRQLSDKCKYTHSSAARHFNKVADTLGLGGVPIVEEEDYEEEQEEEYEEEYEDEE